MTAYKPYASPDKYDTYWSGNQRAPLYKPPQYEPPPLRPRHTPPRRSLLDRMLDPLQQPLQQPTLTPQQEELAMAVERLVEAYTNKGRRAPLSIRTLRAQLQSTTRKQHSLLWDIDARFEEVEELQLKIEQEQIPQAQDHPTTPSPEPVPSPSLPAQLISQTVRATALPSNETTALPPSPQPVNKAVVIQPVNQAASSAVTSKLLTKADMTSDLGTRASLYRAHPPSRQTTPTPYLLSTALIINPTTLGDLYNEFDWKELGPPHNPVLLSRILPAASVFPQFTRLSHSNTTRPAQFFQK